MENATKRFPSLQAVMVHAVYGFREGMVYVDKHDDGTGTLERRVKKSYHWYKKVIATHAADLD